MSLRIVYFAWVRERIGKGSEELDLPESVVTVGDLIAHLATLGEEYAAAKLPLSWFFCHGERYGSGICGCHPGEWLTASSPVSPGDVKRFLGRGFPPNRTGISRA